MIRAPGSGSLFGAPGGGALDGSNRRSSSLPQPGTPPPGWSVENLRFTSRGAARPAVDDVSATVAPGRCTAIIGPNGSGKSTLLRLLLGVLKPDAGEIRLGDRSLSRWSRRDIARTIGVVPQNEEITFPLTVRELVGMGRYPHLRPLQAAGPPDHAAVDAAMTRCDVHRFEDRPIDTLSGGERQRARIARALAQEPTVLAFDEPTLALDIGHEMRIFELVRDFAESGVTVLLVTHHLNLASRYADTLILMNEGAVAAAGQPDEVLNRGMLEEVYRWPIRTTAHPGPGPDTGAVQVTALARSDGEESATTHR
jgi:iron complex transport system ATP-binding protein